MDRHKLVHISCKNKCFLFNIQLNKIFIFFFHTGLDHQSFMVNGKMVNFYTDFAGRENHFVGTLIASITWLIFFLTKYTR